MIKVSVIVPVYKVSLNYLKECFDSLLAQNMQEIEFIVVSDGAPEAECSICDAYAAKDPRFKFFRREHTGVSATRNYGIDQAQGEYLTFVDSDDWIENELHTFWEFAHNTNSEISLCDCTLLRRDSKKMLSLLPKSTTIIPSQIKEDIIRNSIYFRDDRYLPAVSVCCKLYKKSIITGLQFSKNLVYGEDRVFNLSLFLRSNIKLSYFRKNIYNYRKNENSTTEKFNPNTDKLFTNFLYELKVISTNQFNTEIANSALALFFTSWKLNYFNKDNNQSLYKRMAKLEHFYYSDLQVFLQDLNPKECPWLIRIENRLLQQHFWGLVWLHGIKAFLLKRLASLRT